MEGSTLSTLVQMVGAGIGVTLIPEMAARIETLSAPVALSRLPDPTPGRNNGLVWRRRNPLSGTLSRPSRSPARGLAGADHRLIRRQRARSFRKLRTGNFEISVPIFFEKIGCGTGDSRWGDS